MKKKLVVLCLMCIMILTCACGSDKESDLPKVTFGPDITQSAYSHITNGGSFAISEAGGKTAQERLPYDIDAITCATLTIEGPAMKESVPLPVGSLEWHQDVIVRGQYVDKNGTFTYEGADVWSLLEELQESEGIAKTDKAYKVVIKNSNRAEIARFTLDTVKKAHDEGRPIMLAYGKGSKDESLIAPFVFNGANGDAHSLGYEDKLKNDDGCLRLVFDSNTYGDGSYKEFVNAAYVYVCEETEPGYKHSAESGDAYAAKDLRDYVVTFRGETLGYEIDLTTSQLEDLVKYDKNGKVVEGGIGYRDSYSLANNTYWYVNEYEGLKLYELLCYLGMPDYNALGTKAARTTLITFLASDGILSSQSFSVDALSYPDAFGFYQKNAADNNDGTYQPTSADLVKTGYPVLMAYGFNEYPYVMSKKDDGFLSGLSNSGGPFRVVFGKMNYSHTNGSNQVQYLSDVIIGDDAFYSTHKNSNDENLAELANRTLPISFNAAGKDAGSINDFTIADLEDLIYGDKVSANAKKRAQSKVVAGENIYEGVDLGYIISDLLNIPYANDYDVMNGSISIHADDEQFTLTLGDTQDGSFVLCFAKNGTPLVKGENYAGYVKERQLHPVANTDPATYAVDNAGGPVELLVKNPDGTFNYIKNIQSISIDIECDAKTLSTLRDQAAAEALALENAVPNEDVYWNHSLAPEYAEYLKETLEVTVSNESESWTHAFTIEELEKYTDCVYRGKYSTLEIGWIEGIDIWKFIKQLCGYDPQNNGYVASKANDEITMASTPIEGVENTKSITFFAPDGYQIDYVSMFLLENVQAGTKNDDGENMPMLMCYGTKGYPNVIRPTDDGYVEDADNAYGPLRIIVEKSSQASMKNCVKMEIKLPGEGPLNLPK